MPLSLIRGGGALGSSLFSESHFVSENLPEVSESSRVRGGGLDGGIAWASPATSDVPTVEASSSPPHIDFKEVVEGSLLLREQIP